MSKILDLAKSFEQTSNEQAKVTEQTVTTEFKKQEQRLIALLNENEKTISNAIHEQNGRLKGMIRATATTALIWIVICAALLIGILSGIIWFQGQIISSRLSDIDGYSQQLASLKAKSGAGVTIYSDDSQKNGYLVVLPVKAHGVETYTSTAGNTVVKYTAK